jgi:hypothetical protein
MDTLSLPRRGRSPAQTSLAVLRGLAAAISRVSGRHPVVLLALPVVLVGVTVLATLVPAGRAALVDPIQALRCD